MEPYYRLYEDVEHKNEDYETLVRLYDQSNKIILTNYPDVDYQILLNLDIDDLNNFCFTNKYVSQFCNDDFFWINKIKNDQLPNVVLWKSKFDLYNLPSDIHFNKPTSSTDWIKYYKNLKLSYQDAKDTFKIVELESKKNKQRFQFYVTFDNHDLDFFLSILRQLPLSFDEIQEFIINYTNQMKMFTDQCSVCLTDVTELDYYIFKCRHGHHKECVKQLHKKICPVCRGSILKYPLSITVFKSSDNVGYVIAFYINELVGNYYYLPTNIINFLTILYMLDIYYPNTITISDISTPYIPRMVHTSDIATKRKTMIETFRYLNL